MTRCWLFIYKIDRKPTTTEINVLTNQITDNVSDPPSLYFRSGRLNILTNQITDNVSVIRQASVYRKCAIDLFMSCPIPTNLGGTVKVKVRTCVLLATDNDRERVVRGQNGR